MQTPKNEIIWVQYADASGNTTHILTSKSDRSCYYLYVIEKDVLKKLGKAKQPPDLEAKYLRG